MRAWYHGQMAHPLVSLFEHRGVRIALGIYGILLFCALALLVIPPGPKERERATATPAASSTTSTRPTDNVAVEPTGLMEEAEVVRVIDGDTIEVQIGERLEPVRLIGIDTPESVRPGTPVECFGWEASAYTKSQLSGASVQLERDITDRDKYRRLLRYVWKDGVLINQRLVAEGYAQVYTYPPDVKYDALLREAQEDARQAARGLWGGCAEEDISVPPVGGSVHPEEGPNGCSIKGNINIEGEHIYHTPECPYYSRTNISEVRGERWFCSEEEAAAAGWRKALNCEPQ